MITAFSMDELLVKMDEFNNLLIHTSKQFKSIRYKQFGTIKDINSKLIDDKIFQVIAHEIITLDKRPIIEFHDKSNNFNVHYLGFVFPSSSLDTDFYELLLDIITSINNLNQILLSYKHQLTSIVSSIYDEISISDKNQQKIEELQIEIDNIELLQTKLDNILDDINLKGNRGKKNKNKTKGVINQNGDKLKSYEETENEKEIKKEKERLKKEETDSKLHMFNTLAFYQTFEAKLQKYIFIQKLSNLMSICGISKNQLYLALGVPDSTFDGYLNMQKKFIPDYNTLVKLGNIFRVPINYFVFDMYEDNPYKIVSDETGINVEILYYISSLNEQLPNNDILKILNVLLFNLGTHSNPLINLINVILNNSLTNNGSEEDLNEFLNTIKMMKSKFFNKEDFEVETDDYLNVLTAESNYKEIITKIKSRSNLH